ncbi:MAG TPA: SOS response-associated peptidase [Pirellulales bacterium]|jgi:putative SOS response-associated peptidase YedK|nr:SOS response-associated peptidase [Pirellulales bacterium]
MCGRFTLKTPAGDVARLLELLSPVELDARHNIAPTQSVAAVRVLPGEGRQLAMLSWGLIPAWAEEPSIGSRLVNARAETVATKPAFREAFRRRRCLIPADGFYEWQRRGRLKVPFHIRLADGGAFVMAGLWDRWRRGGLEIESCTIITTEANELVRPLHDRMPVILPPQAYSTWLDPSVEDRATLEHWLRPYPAEQMIATAVSSRVNMASAEGPECLETRAPAVTESQRLLDFG